MSEYLPYLPTKKESASSNGQWEPISPQRHFSVYGLRQGLFVWDNTWKWEPKCHTLWVQIVSTLGMSVALTKIRTVLHCVQTSIVDAKIQMCQNSYISALFTTKITKPGAISVMASSGAYWPWHPSLWPSPLQFLLMCTPVYKSTSNETSAQDFGMNRADWNSKFYTKRTFWYCKLILAVNQSLK